MRYLRAVSRPFLLHFMLSKGELEQSFCGKIPFLSVTSRNDSMDLNLSLTTKTPLLSYASTWWDCVTDDMGKFMPEPKGRMDKEN